VIDFVLIILYRLYRFDHQRPRGSQLTTLCIASRIALSHDYTVFSTVRCRHCVSGDNFTFRAAHSRSEREPWMQSSMIFVIATSSQEAPDPFDIRRVQSSLYAREARERRFRHLHHRGTTCHHLHVLDHPARTRSFPKPKCLYRKRLTSVDIMTITLF
jgi:hypothetical protein